MNEKVLCAGNAAFHAFVIPGNPGAAGYYEPFMQALYELYDASIDVTAVSALGIGVDDKIKVMSGVGKP